MTDEDMCVVDFYQMLLTMTPEPCLPFRPFREPPNDRI